MTLHWKSKEVQLDQPIQLNFKSNIEFGFAILLLDYIKPSGATTTAIIMRFSPCFSRLKDFFFLTNPLFGKVSKK